MTEIPFVATSPIRPNVLRNRAASRNALSPCINTACVSSQQEINALKEKVASLEARQAALEALFDRSSASNAGVRLGGRKRKIPRDPPLSVSSFIQHCTFVVS